MFTTYSPCKVISTVMLPYHRWYSLMPQYCSNRSYMYMFIDSDKLMQFQNCQLTEVPSFVIVLLIFLQEVFVERVSQVDEQYKLYEYEYKGTYHSNHHPGSRHLLPGEEKSSNDSSKHHQYLYQPKPKKCEQSRMIKQ